MASVPEDSVWGDVYAASLVVWRSVYDECVGISCLDTDDGCRAKTQSLNPNSQTLDPESQPLNALVLSPQTVQSSHSLNPKPHTQNQMVRV